MTKKPPAEILTEPFDPKNCPYNCAFCYAELDPRLVEDLDQDLEELQTQFTQLQEDALANTQLVQIMGQLEEITKIVNRASTRSKELKADVVLPPKEAMDVRLVPSHSLDRLEEYRSDENKAYLLIGAFFGGILGILCNWATDPNFEVTRPSLVFMGVFFVLALCSVAWAILISCRARKVKEDMLAPKPKT